MLATRVKDARSVGQTIVFYHRFTLGGCLQDGLEEIARTALSCLRHTQLLIQERYVRTRPAKAAEIVFDWVSRDGTEIYAAARCGGWRFQFQGSSSAMRLAG